MNISVILCTYNNSDRLSITLGEFHRLRQPENLEWELIVVNNNSTDDTEEVIKSFSGRLPITYVYEPKQGLSRARNAGLDAAEGQLIVFTDDDVKPVPGWLAAYWKAYQERPEGYYFGGPVESDYEDGPPDDGLMDLAPPSVRGIEWGSEAGELTNGSFIGANWACPKKYIDKSKAFKAKLGLGSGQGAGEETDLMIRLRKKGLKPWYIPSARIDHFVPSKKCTYEHIGNRMEDVAYSSYFQEDPPSVVVMFGIPIGILKEMLVSFAKYIVGINKKRSYIKWRAMNGSISGYFKSRKNGNI